MEPIELAEEVRRTVAKAQSRVGPDSIGAQQYYVPGEPQKFESMDMDDFFEYMEEEALDVINYGVMLHIKVRRAREAWNGSGVDRPNETATEHLRAH